MAVQFSGPFAPMCEKFVAQKRMLGAEYTQQERILRRFDAFSSAYNVEPYIISEELASAWSRKSPNETDANRYNRVMEMLRFSKFLVEQGYASFLTDSYPVKRSAHTPYVFTKEELQRFFHVVDSLEPCPGVPFRHLVMPLLFRLLYGCGLRISETLALTIADVDLDRGILHIMHGKNGRERFVPMSPSLTKRCIDYTEEVLRDKPSDAYFFFRMAGKPYSCSGIEKAFRGFLWDAGIPYLGRERGPSVHDLRHTFVCHRLNQWASEGTDLYAVLPVLSKYLGHTSVLATAWYLRLTADVYPEVIRTMDVYAAGILPLPRGGEEG